MAGKWRKLWSTVNSPVGSVDRRRHESKAEAYRYVQADAANYAASQGRGCTQRVTSVYVDERDGRGWQLYERVDLTGGDDVEITEREA